MNHNRAAPPSPTLGRERLDGEELHICSKCGEPIPDGHVPLMLWNETGERMWVYCRSCEAGILQRLMRASAQ